MSSSGVSLYQYIERCAEVGLVVASANDVISDSNNIFIESIKIYQQEDCDDTYEILLKATESCNADIIGKIQVFFDTNKTFDADIVLKLAPATIDAKAEMSEIEKERIACIKRAQSRQTTETPPPKRQVAEPTPRGGSVTTIWGKKPSAAIDAREVSEVSLDSKHVRLSGVIFEPDFIPTKNDSMLMRFDLETASGAIGCECFIENSVATELQKTIKSGQAVRLDGVAKEHFSTHEIVLQTKWIALEKANEHGRSDDALPDAKRVELHAHTKMSARDAVTNCSDLVALAGKFGHPAVAITDHGVLQSFPEAAKAQEILKKAGNPLKILYGVEGYLVDDGIIPAHEIKPDTHTKPVVVVSTLLDEGKLVKIEARRFASLTGLDDYANEPSVLTLELEPRGDIKPRQALTMVKEFCQDNLVAAINDLEDLHRIRILAEAEGITKQQELPLHFNPAFIELSEWKRSGLSVSLESEKDDLLSAHYEELRDLWLQAGVKNLLELNNKLGRLNAIKSKEKGIPSYHIILLAATQCGMYNMYRLVSNSHLNYFYYRPRMPRSEIRYFGDGILLGSACERGEIFQRILEHYLYAKGDASVASRRIETDSELQRLARFYTWLEIQPVSNNLFMLDRRFGEHEYRLQNETELQTLNKLIVELASLVDKPVCATCDAHFLNSDDMILRDIVLTDIGMDTNGENPTPLFFRNTPEMLSEFAYLDEKTAQEVVVTNTQKIANLVSGEVLPVPRGQFPPHIACAEDSVMNLALTKAKVLYGDSDGKLPELIQERLDKELKSIIQNGFAVMYYVAHLMVKASNDAGFLVGSRGSVGSSFVATMCGISEVNPLPPHYVCPNCHHFEAVLTGEYGSGYDLPEATCPRCDTKLKREGQEIPFETFLGFYGEKQPDIDLNFAAGFREQAKQVAEELFGSDHTFRAGTISGYAEKNAIAMVRKYYETKGTSETMAGMRRLARRLNGLKRTTGQHPGGVMVIPKTHEIYDFTAVQHPADKSEGQLITTHFDYHALHDTILKLDVLGHDDPTMLKVLHDRTGIDIESIPIPDAGVMQLFHGVKSLQFKHECQDKGRIGTIGLPEIGTQMARDMIRQTKPKRIFDLYQLSGLSHGTNVWKGNAQDLISDGVCTLESVIGCRDSIMTTLIHAGLEAQEAFAIMEQVRKGKGLKPNQEEMMLKHNMPQWYIDSCKKIAYMFPKSHAAAYIISALRIGWFKVHMPAHYYAAYLTVRGGAFNAKEMNIPLRDVTRFLAENRAIYRQLKPTEVDKFDLLEILEEMMFRGIKFAPISLINSEATEFVAIAEDTILMPFVAWPGIGTVLAESIVAARSVEKFHYSDDLKHRVKIGQTAMDCLHESGCLSELPVSAQISMFDDFG